MATLTHICGFEENGYTDGPYGAGVHSYTDGGAGDGLTFDASIKRNGRFALKNTGGILYQYMTATAHSVGSIWFRWNGTTTNGGILLFYNIAAGFKINASGQISGSAGSTYTNGPIVAADTWHQLDFYLNVSANPRVLKWKVNSVAQTDVSYAAAATTLTAVALQNEAGGSVWFDDWALSVTGADYPLGPLAVEAIYPTGDGTHVNQSKFKDESLVVSSGSNTYQKVDDDSVADFWWQETADATAYHEWTLNNTSRTNAIRGVAASAGLRKSGPYGTNDGSVILRANSNNGTVKSGDFGWASESFFGYSAIFLTAPGGAAWTASILNAAVIRAGFATSVSPSQPYWGWVILEVAFVDVPNETGGGGDPDPVVGTPGIWIDWVGDGTWVDETTRTMSVNWTRGASSDHVSAPGPGNATVILQNSDDRFNPDNSGSPLYGLMLPSRPIWCGADRTTGSLVSATEVRGFFAGYVSELAPHPVPGGNPTAELLCEDALGWYRRATATVSPTRDVSRGAFRQQVLTSMGEAVGRRELESEAEMMPFAAVDARDGLGVLEELNRSDSARHFIAPADTKEDWYDYTLDNRLHKLTAAADEAWNADDIQDLSGYRVTVDNIDNLQRALVSPISFGALNEIVWSASPLPIIVTVGQPIVLWAEFADYVFGAAVQANSTGGTLTTTLTNFGTSAKLELTASGSVVNITSLDVTGSSLRHGDLQTVRSEDLVSQGIYEIRAGGDVTTDFIGQPGAAKAITDYLIWKFSDPLKRPTVTRAGKDAATITSLMDRDLFDVITLTVDRLQVVSRRFEIIGISGSCVPKSATAPFYSVSYELQETANQSPLDYFIIDVSSINGAKLIAPF